MVLTPSTARLRKVAATLCDGEAVGGDGSGGRGGSDCGIGDGGGGGEEERLDPRAAVRETS
jgi:hypothetical protein